MPTEQPEDAENPRDAVSREEAAGLEWAAAEYERRHGPPPPPRWASPGALAREIHPKTINTPALELIDEALVSLGPDERLIITMAPQEGKSQRVAHDFILWWLVENPTARCAVASYGQSLATRNGLKVRRSIENHDLGLEIAPDNGSAGEWELTQADDSGERGGLFSVGIGGPFGGKPVDLLVIDDPIKDRKEADSPVFRQSVWEWWTDVASARLGPGAPVVLILTRWHDDDLAGRLLEEPDSDWKVLNIPAQADYRPDLGETDILDRQPGEFMISARGRTLAQWQQRKKTAGVRSWQALYQGDPAPTGGLVFNPEDLRFWTRFPLKANDTVIYLSQSDIQSMWQAESWDLTFTGDATSDWVAGQRWAGSGSRRFLIARRHGQWEFTEQISQMVGLVEEEPTNVTTRLVEKAANGAAALSTLKGVVGGLRPIKPTESKEARAIAVTPQVEAHDVYFPDPTDPGNEWVYEVIEEMRLFPTGKHDDEVDAMTQFLNWAKNRGIVAAAQPMSAWERGVDVQRVG